jgi:hypothetical protein
MHQRPFRVPLCCTTSRVFRQSTDTGNSAATLNGTERTTVATLGSASLPITLNRSYRTRLETIGTRLRLYVDDQLLAEASDSSLSHDVAGVMMFRTKADYDNVVVSSAASGTDNWFGLATRFRDAGNYYYYITIRNNNTVSLRKLVNGAITDSTLRRSPRRRTPGIGCASKRCATTCASTSTMYCASMQSIHRTQKADTGP